MPRGKRSDIRYKVYVQPMRGKPKLTTWTIGVLLPETIEWDGGTYHFAYLDTREGYAVFNEEKP